MDLHALKSSLNLDEPTYKSLPEHVAAFCAFVSPATRKYGFPSQRGAAHAYQSLAALGYSLAVGHASAQDLDRFVEGTKQLSGRIFFTASRAIRFEIDGIALLGITLGYRAIAPQTSETVWLTSVLEQSCEMLKTDSWQASLARTAQALLSSKDVWDACDSRLTVSMRAALGQSPVQDQLAAAWDAIIVTIGDDDPVQIAVNQGVFEVCAAALASLPIHRAGVSELISLLEGVTQSMSHWTYEEMPRVKGIEPQHWEIDHEYHVQNLLWTILRPVFPDLVDEQSLPKIGHTSPRYDLGIPSLNTIIEVKYMRKRGQSQLKKITDEIAADHSLYLGERTNYSKLIVFIWDECRQTEEYKTLTDGLECLKGIEKVLVLSRPARMIRQSAR